MYASRICRTERNYTPPERLCPDNEVLCMKLPQRPWFRQSVPKQQRTLLPFPKPKIPIAPTTSMLDSRDSPNMDISHPRRVLAVSLPDDGLASLIQGLTNTIPSKAEGTNSIAGLTINYSIKTPYYKAEVPIWLDEVSNPKDWSAEFLTSDAKEVVAALGAFIVCFRQPIDKAGLQVIQNLLENVAEVVKKGCGASWDGACLAVGMPQSTTPYLEMPFDEWEDLCQKGGFEYIDFASKGNNEFSEPTGLDRLKQALESNDWAGDESEDVNFDDFDEDDEETEGSIGFGIGAEEMEDEMGGMKKAIYQGSLSLDENDDDQDDEVEKLQAMMLKMQAVKDMGADLPESERKKLAAKAVGEIMKTL